MKTLKRYKEEAQILDGILITLFLAIFMMFYWDVFKNQVLNTFSMVVFLTIIMFIVIRTLKDIFDSIDEINIMLALTIAMIFLVLNTLALGIVMFWIACIYCFVFLYISARNLILKEFLNNKKIKW